MRCRPPPHTSQPRFGASTVWNDTGYTETSRADDKQTRGDVWCDLRSLIPRSAVYADTRHGGDARILAKARCVRVFIDLGAFYSKNIFDDALHVGRCFADRPGSKHKSHALVLRAWPARCGICGTGTLGSGSGASIAMPCILFDHRGSGMREAEPTSFATEPDQITPEHLEPGKPHCQRLEAV